MESTKQLRSPKWMNDEQREYFVDLRRVLEQRKNLTMEDEKYMIMMTTSWFDYVNACKAIAEDGPLITQFNARGQAKTAYHPAFIVKEKAYKQFCDLMKMYDLDPESGSPLANAPSNPFSQAITFD